MTPLDLASDNVAGASPEILEAIASASRGTASSYGADAESRALDAAFSAVFETETSVFPVVSGTAANAIALASLCPPYGAIACSDCAHVLTSECGAPEFYAGGAKLTPVATRQGLIEADALDATIAAARGHGVHQSQVHAVSLTQATEWGTVYGADAIAAIARVAHAAGAAVHMDGARFANAVVRLGVRPADLTWRAGIDILSFGATKNGALAAEAIVVFSPARATGIAERRKRAGHLLSKQRFVSAQLRAYLADELWLRNASNANDAAQHLGRGLARIGGVSLVMPVEANEVFVRVPHALADGLERCGIGFYRWSVERETAILRFVTSFATRIADIDQVIAIAAGTR